MSEKEIISSYLETLHRNKQIASDIAKSSLSRLVWLVGLAGFAIINAQPYWQNIANIQANEITIFWLSLPLIVSILFGVVTHILTDEMVLQDSGLYTVTVSLLEMHILSIGKPEYDPNEFFQITGYTHPSLEKLQKKLGKLALIVKWTERLTFITFGLGFVWAIIGPLFF